jgi:hypothetical protein
VTNKARARRCARARLGAAIRASRDGHKLGCATQLPFQQLTRTAPDGVLLNQASLTDFSGPGNGNLEQKICATARVRSLK